MPRQTYLTVSSLPWNFTTTFVTLELHHNLRQEGRPPTTSPTTTTACRRPEPLPKRLHPCSFAASRCNEPISPRRHVGSARREWEQIFQTLRHRHRSEMYFL
ncbi:hypothetical protein BaRGS_00032812 [Batillaria attramentaria]|uniref:Uncharacterized protein n=1 Tax=Batillaria attramentaria TaxID=370345 RepID=A0ABD0JMB9_9CAEN